MITEQTTAIIILLSLAIGFSSIIAPKVNYHQHISKGLTGVAPPTSRPFTTNKKPSGLKASVTTALIVCQTRHNKLGPVLTGSVFA